MCKVLNLALCKGRHEIPDATDGAIFSVIQNVTDTEALERHAFTGLWNAAFKRWKAGESGFLRTDPEWDESDAEPLMFVRGLKINLYVTGLTVALIAALNVCRAKGLSVTLWHYNKDTDDYFPQEVL